MRARIAVGVIALVFGLLMLVASAFAAEKPRLAILTDIGGDPDDQQSLIRLCVYANEFDIELLLASSSGTRGELKTATTRPDLIAQIVDAYAEVLPRLKRHADGWPEADQLRRRIHTGNVRRGIDAIGESQDSPASRAIIERVDAGSPQRPLNVAIWGGQTDLAQALWRIQQDRGAAGLQAFVGKLRVYDIDDQDGLANYIYSQFPGMFYILAKSPPGQDKRRGCYRGMYLTGDESLTSQAWIESNIKSRGALGALYPMKTWTAPNPHGCMKEGDTPSWFFFLPLGGNDPADPTRPGWGGQFQRSEQGPRVDPKNDPSSSLRSKPPAASNRAGVDRWYIDLANDDPRKAVSRWRPEFQADFARRMNWCVALPDSP